MFGPILTTGVALSAAVVVVTNPVTAPHTDVQIPAAAVSAGTGQAVDMLNEDFIEAVGPSPAPSNNPLAVLRDLVNALVADAADFGKTAVLHAFAAGASVVSDPELTAASHPYAPSSDSGPVPGPVPVDLRPVVQQAFDDVLANAGTLIDADAVAAAVSAGAALGTDPATLLESLRQVVDGAGQADPANALSALAALPRPQIGDAVRAAVQKYLPAVPSVTDIAALPDRWATQAPDLPQNDAPAVGIDPSDSVPKRPVVERALTAVRSVAKDAGVTAPVLKAGAARRGVGHLGSGLNRQGLSDAAGAIGRAVKAHADRTPD